MWWLLVDEASLVCRLKTERQQEDLEKLKEEKMDLQRHCDKMLAAQESHER